MKQKVKKIITCDAIFCNICEKEIEFETFNKKRIEIIKGLFNTQDFDAHENCINQIIRNTFNIYVKNE